MGCLRVNKVDKQMFYNACGSPVIANICSIHSGSSPTLVFYFIFDSQICLYASIMCVHVYACIMCHCLCVHVSGTCRLQVIMCLRVIQMWYTTYTCPTVFSTCECLMTPSLTCCSTWWPRSGSWICPSCSSQSTGACRTLNYSPSSNRSLAKGSSKLPWRQEPGSSPVGSTQVIYSGYTQLVLRTNVKQSVLLWNTQEPSCIPVNVSVTIRM